MNTLQRGILLILKSAVTGENYPLPEGFSLEEALPIVKKHQLVTLFYQGGVNCGLDEHAPEMMSLFQSYCKQMLRSERQMAAVASLCDTFEENGIDYMLLKGCIMKPLYPRPELRIMGDADILIRTEQYDRIQAVVTALGYQPGVESDHEYVWDSPALYLELHKRLIPSYNADYYAYYGDGWRLAKHREGFRYAMTREDEFIYQFTHFAKHYRDGGIGCRHVLDLWVYLRAYPSLDMAYIQTELGKLGIGEFYENVRRLLDAWFDNGKLDDRLELMTDFLFDSGSWGKRKNHVLSAELKNRKVAGSARGGRVRSVCRMLFPALQDMVFQYPILKKAPWLLPVIWLVRWVKVLLFRRAKLRVVQREFRAATAEKVDEFQWAMNYVGLDFNFKE